MRPVTLILDQAHTNALTTRDLRCAHAAMRYGRKDPQAAPDGFDVTLEHITGRGAAVTGSGPTLHDALRRAIDAFDQYVRPTINTRKEHPHGPPEQNRDQPRTRTRTRTRDQPRPPETA